MTSRQSWLSRLPALKRLEDLDRLAASLTNFERTMPGAKGTIAWSLVGMRQLYRVLGRPLDSIPSVHVAGSKGKGSTCHLLESLLRAQGLRTGLYTSPHVERWTERVRVHGRPVKAAQFLAAIGNVLHRASLTMHSPPTFFETLTAAAFCIFEEEQIDAAVVEVGLGGRLDATNVIRSSVCLLTSIELEHTAVLGRSLSAIAQEKVGIFKTGVPVISGLKRGDAARRAVLRAAKKQQCRLWEMNQELRLECRAEGILVHLPQVTLGPLPQPAGGPFAAQNALLATAAIALLGEEHPRLEIRLDAKRLRKGLSRARIPGRAEIIGERPTVIRDGAHTPKSLGALVHWAERRYPFRNPVVVFGINRDKRLGSCLRAMRPWIGPLIATKAPSDRALRPERIVQAADRLGMKAWVVEDPLRALVAARRAAGRTGLVLITGSFWLIGLFRARRRRPARRG